MTSGPRYREDFFTVDAPTTTSLEPRISSLEQGVASVKADADAHETLYQALTLKVNTAEGNIANLSGQVTNSVTLANQNKTDVSGLNVSVAGLQTTLSSVQTSFSQQVSLLQEQIGSIGAGSTSVSDLETEINRVDGRVTSVSNTSGLTRNALQQLLEIIFGPAVMWPVGSGTFTVPVGEYSLLADLTARVVALEEAAAPPQLLGDWLWSLDAKRGETLDLDAGSIEVTKWRSITNTGATEKSWSPVGTPYLNDPPGYVYLNATNHYFQAEAESLFGKTIYTVVRFPTGHPRVLFDMGDSLRLWVDHHIDGSNQRTIPLLTYKGGDGVTHQMPDGGAYAPIGTSESHTNSVAVFKASVAADHLALGILNGLGEHWLDSKLVSTSAHAAGIMRFAPEFMGNVYELVLYDGIHDDTKSLEVMTELMARHNH